MKTFYQREKRRKVRDLETISYYRSLYQEIPRGKKELSEEIVEYVAKHKNEWLRNMLRHYIQYLCHGIRTSLETFS
ncbi:MAG: hypothetical protein QW607_01695 [Desulfurococcaceae archaeon]